MFNKLIHLITLLKNKLNPQRGTKMYKVKLHNEIFKTKIQEIVMTVLITIKN